MKKVFAIVLLSLLFSSYSNAGLLSSEELKYNLQVQVQNKNCADLTEMKNLIDLLRPEFPKAQFVINKKCKIEIVNLKELQQL